VLLEKPDRKRGFKKERMLRILLDQPDGSLSKYRIAKQADVSEPWCLEYTNRLENKGLIKDTEVVKPRKLFEEWKSVRVEPNQLTVSVQEPMQLLDDSQLAYALTTYEAENLVQGFLFTSTTDFYIKPDEIKKWLTIIENKGMVGGGNTRIQVTDDHVFYNTQTVQGRQLVSTPQLILDLLVEGGPCKQAADKLIDKTYGDEK
jgi:DNA-binding Lrp family transcriptional regulator